MGLGDKIKSGLDDAKSKIEGAEDTSRIKAGEAKVTTKVKGKRFLGTRENQTAALISVASTLVVAGLGSLGYWLWRKKQDEDKKLRK